MWGEVLFFSGTEHRCRPNEIITRSWEWYRGASQDELKTAFRNLARKFHPDVNSDPAAEQNFKEINQAYGILSDPDKRAAYDRYGHAGVDNMNGMPDFSNFDMFSDLFEGLFGFGMGGGGRRRTHPEGGRIFPTPSRWNLTRW